MSWQKKGFSVIEITIVLLLIAILVTIGISSYRKSVDSAYDTDKKIAVIEIEKFLIAESIGSATNFIAYEDKDELVTLLQKNGIKIDDSREEYHYFATDDSFAVATCLSNNQKFYKGGFEPTLDCSNLLAQSIASGSNNEIHIKF